VIVANLYPIKSTNGLYYYALDYLQEHSRLLRRVLVRPTMAAEASRSLPGTEVVVCGWRQLLAEARRARRDGDLLFTPTPHPLPAIHRQWIVVHDAYPFLAGWRGLVKRAMLTLSLATSRCQVAYINRSDALQFVGSLGVSDERRVFAPNRFPERPALRARVAPWASPLIIGLVGTDSAKKNYARLFAALSAFAPGAPLAFRVYGHDSAYLREVRQQSPHASITLVSSDRVSLDTFFQDIHVLASVATQEGFGRPIAAALLAGIPCVLVECAVFREFFDGAAIFQPDAQSVARFLVEAARTPPSNPRYSPPADAVDAWKAANARLSQLGHSPDGILA
jgi:hypothetical protein